MAAIGFNTNRSSPKCYVQMNVTDNNDGSSSTNQSTVSWNVTISTASGSWATSWTSWGQKIYLNIWIDGQNHIVYVPNYNYGGANPPGSIFASGTKTVSHNNDGTKSISFSVEFVDNANGNNNGKYYTPGDGSASGSMTLATIPRYFSSTPSLSFKSKTETSITYNWSTSEKCSEIKWSGGGTASTTGVGGTSGTVTFTGLSPNTAYTHSGVFKRSDSGLTTSKSAASVATYAYPYLTSVPEFTVGNSLTIGIYNPLGRSCTISVIGDNGTETNGGTITNTNISGFNNDSWKNIWYQTLPAKTQGKYRARLKCSTGNVNQVSGYVKYYLNTSDAGFKPGFNANNIINIVNTAHTDISGSNKFIKKHNSLSGVIKPMTPQRYSSGDYYNVSSSGVPTVQKDHTGSNVNFVLGNLSTNSFNVTAVDSRGFTTTTTKNVTLVDYNNPGVTNARITRQNGIGTKVILSFKGVYTNWSGLNKSNSITAIRYKIGASGTWKNLPSSASIASSNGVWTLNATLDDTFTVTSQYELYLEIKDLLEVVTVGPYTISTADAFVWKDLANKRVGINKKPSHTLSVGGTLQVDKGIKSESINILNSLNVDETKTSSGSVSSVSWIHLCHIKIKNKIQGYMFSGMILGGDGNNGNPHQNICGRLTFQIGYNGSNGGQPGVVCETFSGTGNRYKLLVKLCKQDNLNYDLWVKKISTYCRFAYAIQADPDYIEVTDIYKTYSETEPNGAAGNCSVANINSGLAAYPVGSIYMTINKSVSPADLFGGTWERIAAEKYLMGFNASNAWFDKPGTSTGSNGKSGSWNTDSASGNTGSTTLNINQIPAHNHGAAGDHKHWLYLNQDSGFPVVGNPGWSGGTWNSAFGITAGPATRSGYKFGTDYVGGHTHTTQGGGQGHTHSLNNHQHFHVLPFYIVCVWKRTG